MATTTTPHAGSLHRQRRFRRIGMVILYTLFGIVAFTFTLPFFLMMSNAFKTSSEILRIPPTFIPRDPSLSSFRTVINEAPYFRWFGNSLLVSLSVTAMVLLTCSLAGYIFAKFTFPGRDAIFVVLLMTMMVPFPVLLIPSYLVVNKLGLVNSLWALIVPGMTSAFGIFLMRQFIAGIPNDLIEAARLDGASEWAIFARIVVPLARPPMAALGIFTFLAAWNDYLWPLIVINDLNKSTLPLALTFFNSQHAQRYDLVMAAAAMAVIPVIIVFVIFQRQIVNALVLAGLK
ncbi:MAG TPA: carbohydrate ABC transporter permease [Thermomicrobiales bacterium]|jgi:multiple sugar transport system permease protein|nr:carbohydrate ABC transporter permease [Thermomicrobiales bacterium]